jgi:hypothetical protein
MWASNAASRSQNRQQWVAMVAGSFLVAALIAISRESGADFAQDYAAAWHGGMEWIPVHRHFSYIRLAARKIT